MNYVFQPFIDEFVIVFLVDILVFIINWDEHVKHVRKFLETLKKEKLYVKLSRCEFGKDSLVYLGYIVGSGELKTDPSKVEVILNWPNTTSTT